MEHVLLEMYIEEFGKPLNEDEWGEFVLWAIEINPSANISTLYELMYQE